MMPETFTILLKLSNFAKSGHNESLKIFSYCYIGGFKIGQSILELWQSEQPLFATS